MRRSSCARSSARCKRIGAYLGDEVVLAVPSVNGKIQDPLVIAEVTRPGLSAFLEQQFGQLKAVNGTAPLLVQDPPKCRGERIESRASGDATWKHGRDRRAGGIARESGGGDRCGRRGVRPSRWKSNRWIHGIRIHYDAAVGAHFEELSGRRGLDFRGRHGTNCRRSRTSSSRRTLRMRRKCRSPVSTTSTTW